MAFWDDASTLSPKQAHRWVIYLNNNRTTALYFKSVDKPSFAIKNIKTKYLYSHEFNFPGRVSWQPITLVLNDLIIYNDKKDFTVDWRLSGNPSGTTKKINESTQSFIYGLLNKAGYYSPNEAAQTTYESNLYLREFNFKKSLVSQLIGSSSYLEIQELDNEIGVPPGGNSVEIKPFGVQGERWKLFNPLISDVKFEKLDYSVDNALSITLTLNYDWAELHGPEGATAAAPSAPTVTAPPAPKTEEKVNLPKVVTTPPQTTAPSTPPPVAETPTVGRPVDPTPPEQPAPAIESAPIGTPSTPPPQPDTSATVAVPVVDVVPVGTSSTTEAQPSGAPSPNVAPSSDATSPATPVPAVVVDTPPVGQPAVDKPAESAPTAKTAAAGGMVGPPEPDTFTLTTGEKVSPGAREARIKDISVKLENYNAKEQNPSGVDTDILKAIKEQIPQLEQRLSDLKNVTPGMLPPIGGSPNEYTYTNPEGQFVGPLPKPEPKFYKPEVSQIDLVDSGEYRNVKVGPPLGEEPSPPPPAPAPATPRVTDFSSAADPQLAQRAQQYIRDPSATLEQKTAIAGTLASQGVLLDLAGTGLENDNNAAALKDLASLAKSDPQSAAAVGSDFQRLISSDNPLFAKPAKQESPVAVTAVQAAPPPPPVNPPQTLTPPAPKQFTFDINKDYIRYNLDGASGQIVADRPIPKELLQQPYSSQINAAFQERLQQLAKKENTSAIGTFQDIFLLQASYNIAATPGYAGKFVNNIDSTADWYALYNKYRK